MLTYELDAKNSRSLYEQLYQAIRSDIELARLDAGSKLPSKRTLAQHLGISVITVESAYRQLAAEGYIEAKERRGYFVNELPSVQAHDMSAGSEQIEHQLNAEAAARQIDPVRLSISSVPSIQATPLLADFSGNDRSGNQFPFHIWGKNGQTHAQRGFERSASSNCARQPWVRRIARCDRSAFGSLSRVGGFARADRHRSWGAGPLRGVGATSRT